MRWGLCVGESGIQRRTAERGALFVRVFRPGDMVAVFIAAAALAAVFHVFPVVLPFLAPLEFAVAHGTDFRGKVAFLMSHDIEKE